MTALPSSFYQFFGANSQDQRQRVDHLVHKRRVDVQMSNDRDESSPPPKTAADGLPRRDTTRWTARRKVAVVEAVLGGVISREEVCRRYGLSINEVLSWQNTLQMPCGSQAACVPAPTRPGGLRHRRRRRTRRRSSTTPSRIMPGCWFWPRLPSRYRKVSTASADPRQFRRNLLLIGRT